MRIDGRNSSELRKVKITPNVSLYSEGSALIEAGNTKVLCTATVEPGAPKWLQGSGKGWVTAEYGMLPRSTATRVRREKAAGSGRTMEISRLIGRALRSVVDLGLVGDRQITVDCDVLQADGGTRTAAITGGFVALAFALKHVKDTDRLFKLPLRDYVGAISVGIHGGQALLDLCYEEDSAAETDMNFVMTGSGKFVEVQGTAEQQAFSRQEMNAMTDLGEKGIRELFLLQSECLGSVFPFPKA